jgi:hypothetical protein
MKTNRISKALRIVFCVILLIVSGIGCISAFSDGDRQNGFLMLIVFAFAVIYGWFAFRGKDGFGQV